MAIHLLKSAFCPYWEPLYWCGHNLESVISFRYIPCIPDLTFSVDNVRTTSITSHLESFLISSSGTPFCLKKSNCNYLVLCYKNCSDLIIVRKNCSSDREKLLKLAKGRDQTASSFFELTPVIRPSFNYITWSIIKTI